MVEKQQCSQMDKQDAIMSFPVKYVASFMVTGDDQDTRLNCVHIHLEAMRRAAHIGKPISLDARSLAQLDFFQRTLHNSKPVLFDASSSGIRIRSTDGQMVHMVHALKRISYATCDPDSCQFAFSARQPSSALDANDGSKVPPISHPLPGVLYCHVFLTDSPDQAKKMNDYVSEIFREAERGTLSDTIYYDFAKNFSQDVTNHQSMTPLSTPSSAFNGDEKIDELLERRKEEKRFSDLCHMLALEQGPCPASQHFKELHSSSDSGMGTIPEAKYYASHEILPPSVPIFKKSGSPIDDPSPAQQRRLRYLGSASLDQPMNGIVTKHDPVDVTIFCEPAAGFSVENGTKEFKSPLRPESKRQKRRPLSAVLTDFAGAGKRRTSTTCLANEERSNDMRRVSMLESVLERNEGPKSGSILKRLLHLRIGSGSSLRLNLLSNESSPTKSSDQSNGIFNSRQRSSQSVRFLGASLDQADDNPCASNSHVLNVASKRRRPLSAVFGNASIHLPNGHAIISANLISNGGLANGYGHGIPPRSAETPPVTKKMGSAKSAVSKMFGFSSSRRKSRSSAQLDMARHRTDLDISDSIPDGHDSVFVRLARNDPPSTNEVRNWKQQQSINCLTDTDINCGSPLLGSGVGCGEQCSISMPNLRCGIEQSLPLSVEEEAKLNCAAWFYGTVSRQLATQVLELEQEGAFIVRRSVSQPTSSLVLSVRVPFSHNPSGVSHYLILHTAKGFKLKGFTKDFPSVHALVTHHSFMAEQLPCRLVFTDREAHESKLNRCLFNASSCSMSNMVFNDHQYQTYQKRSSHSRHSSPYINKKRDLVPVTEEESVYGKLPSPPPPPPEQASSTLFAALKIADAKVF